MECKLGRCCCGLVIAAILAAALTMWITGCNPDVPAGCLTSTVYTGKLINITIEWGQCCQIDNGGNTQPPIPRPPATAQSYPVSPPIATIWQTSLNQSNCYNDDYSCCIAHRTWALLGTNYTCTDESDVHHNCDMALGTDRMLAYNPNTGECVDANSSKVMWYIGVSVLFLYFSVLVCGCLTCCRSSIQDCKTGYRTGDWRVGVEQRVQVNHGAGRYGYVVL